MSTNRPDVYLVLQDTCNEIFYQVLQLEYDQLVLIHRPISISALEMVPQAHPLKILQQKLMNSNNIHSLRLFKFIEIFYMFKIFVPYNLNIVCIKLSKNINFSQLNYTKSSSFTLRQSRSYNIVQEQQ